MRERKPLKVEGATEGPMDRSTDERMANAGARTIRPARTPASAREMAPAPETAPERQFGADEMRRAALEQGFASDRRRRRSVHTGTVAFKVRPGMPDLLEDICYLNRLKKQELFEEMLAAWLNAADICELTAKYEQITGRQLEGQQTTGDE